MRDCLDDNLFELLKISFLILIYRFYKCFITLELISVNELILLDVITVKNALSTTTGFFIMSLSSKFCF